MSQLHSLISTVIASAVDRAARDAAPGDVALGLLAGLRRIRMVVGAQAGYAAACGIDDAIHRLFVERALEGGRGGLAGWGGVPVALPKERSARTLRACLILEDTAMSCLTLNGYFQGNTALNLGVQIMAERLLDCLGAVPGWAEVVRELRLRDADDDEVNVERWSTVALQ